MEAHNATTETVEGWTATKEHADSVFFDNDNDGATVSVEPYENYNSNADYVVKSDYIGVNCVMGRVRACLTFEEAMDVATEHMEENN